MSLSHSCPGARTIREPTPEYTNCPHCGREIEVWSDEPLTRCPHCHGLVLQRHGASCLDWCPHAAECVGPEALERWRRAGSGE